MSFGKRRKKACERLVGAACALVLGAGLVPTAAFADPSALEGAQPSSGAAAGSFVSDEIIVVFGRDASPAAADEVQGEMRARALSADETIASASTAGGKAVVARVEEGMSIDEAIERAEQIPGVEYAQPNYRYYLPEDAASVNGESDSQASGAPSTFADDAATSVDDSDAAKEYYLKSWEDGYGVDAYGAWDAARAEGEVTIAVLDTGIRVDHEDLNGNILTDYMRDIYANTPAGTIVSDGVPDGDNCGHGTHVAGIAAASANNAVGIAGASFNANILPLKVFDNTSDNPSCTTSDLVKAYDYLFDLVTSGSVDDLHVINMSLGGYASPDATDRLLEEKIKTAAETYDIMTVAAGGNGDNWGNPLTIPSYPSDFDAVVSVTATNQYGENVSWSDYNEFKDISAPGYSIYSTYNSSYRSYSYLSGTSMASPLVAGVASLLWAVYPDLTVEDAKTSLYETANGIDPSTENYRDDAETGSHGVVDAKEAVAYVEQHFADSGRTALSACTIESIPDQYYTGVAVEPEGIVVKDGEKTLEEGVDYETSFRNNVEVGTASVTVSGKGEYVGYASATFSIRYDIAQGTIVTSAPSYEYTGNAIEPEVRVVCLGRLLTEGEDFELSYADNVEVGAARIEARGLGSYMGLLAGSFEIRADENSLASAEIGAIEPQTFTGSPIEPKPAVTAKNGALLEEGVDYELTYADNVHAGEASVTATGKGAYSGSCSTTFDIDPASADDMSVFMEQSSVSVGQDPSAIALSLSIADTVLEENVDYTVTFQNIDRPGYAVAFIEGLRDVTGSREVRFRVVDPNAQTFADVSAVDWFAPWALQASQLGIVRGHQDDSGQFTGSFGPEESLTRAQAAIMLARAAGVDLPSDPVASNGAFEDNEDGQYYTAAINWASEAGILRGDEPDRSKVRPSASVTRAELAVMMARFAAIYGVDTSAASPEAFYDCVDYRDVPDWAVSAMVWTAANDIMSGFPLETGNELRCQNDVSRAQMAKVVIRAAETIYGIPPIA